MGRAFEFRKVRKLKRWDAMAKAFTRIGKDIVMAVKAGGPDPSLNARLRVVIQNAKGVNMPKDRIENAIKRASSKEEKDFEEIVYEGYGPYGVPILVECATDNPTRTVANIRMYFTRAGGTLGKTGSLDFMFVRKGVFKLDTGSADPDELELELIDHGLEELIREDDGFTIITAFQDFGTMQKALEDRNITVKSSQLQRFPTSLADISEEEEEEVLKLVEKIEEDDDVQAVYHNLK